jgi:hypothetical protein
MRFSIGFYFIFLGSTLGVGASYFLLRQYLETVAAMASTGFLCGILGLFLKINAQKKFIGLIRKKRF